MIIDGALLAPWTSSYCFSRHCMTKSCVGIMPRGAVNSASPSLLLLSIHNQPVSAGLRSGSMPLVREVLNSTSDQAGCFTVLHCSVTTGSNSCPGGLWAGSLNVGLSAVPVARDEARGLRRQLCGLLSPSTLCLSSACLTYLLWRLER